MYALLILILLLPYAQSSKHPDTQNPRQQAKNASNPEDSSAGKISDQINQSTSTSNRETDDPPDSKAAKFTAWATWLYAFFTIVLCALVFFQIRAYWAKERAWMIMDIQDGNPATNHEDGIQIVEFTADIKNYGHSPAVILKVDHSADIMKREEKLPLHPKYLSLPEVSYSAPDPIVPKGGSAVYWKITQKSMDALTSGERLMYVYGRIVYKDIFGRKRETRYCFRYFPRVPGKVDRHVGFFPDGPTDYHKLS
jgi:hypothetical protein